MSSQSVRKAIQKTTESVALKAYLSVAQLNLTGDAWNKITLNTIQYDLGGNFDTVLNRGILPVTGLYRIEGSVEFSAVVADKRFHVAIYKNGGAIREVRAHASMVGNLTKDISDELYLEKDDYIELYAMPEVGGGVDTVDVASGTGATKLIIRLITKEGIRQ